MKLYRNLKVKAVNNIIISSFPREHWIQNDNGLLNLHKTPISFDVEIFNSVGPQVRGEPRFEELV